MGNFSWQPTFTLPEKQTLAVEIDVVTYFTEEQEVCQGLLQNFDVGDTQMYLVEQTTTQYCPAIPVINGIVVTEDLKSAEDRVHGSIDRGSEFAQAALFMGQIKKKWTKI